MAYRQKPPRHPPLLVPPSPREASNLRQLAAASRRSGNSKLSTNVRKKKVPGPGELQNNIRTGINFHNECAQCYVVWQSSSQTLAFWNTQQPAFPDSLILRHPMVLATAYWRFRGVESLSAFAGSFPLVGFSISSAISPGRFRCAAARSNGSTHSIIHRVFEERWHSRHEVIVPKRSTIKTRVRNFFPSKIPAPFARTNETIDEFHGYTLSSCRLFSLFLLNKSVNKYDPADGSPMSLFGLTI